MRSRFCSAWALASLALFAPTSAPAQSSEKGFELCNRTQLTVKYAKALNIVSKEEKEKGNEYRFEAEGWFNLAPGGCEVLWRGGLRHRYYLIYAEAAASNRKWTGHATVCVENEQFKQILVGLCAPGKNSRKFLEVDTGDAKSFTYDLR